VFKLQKSTFGGVHRIIATDENGERYQSLATASDKIGWYPEITSPIDLEFQGAHGRVTIKVAPDLWNGHMTQP